MMMRIKLINNDYTLDDWLPLRKIHCERVKGGKTISKGSYDRKKYQRFHLGIKLEKNQSTQFNHCVKMLPETSSLPLLQPPSIEFINNQFHNNHSSEPQLNGSIDSSASDQHHHLHLIHHHHGGETDENSPNSPSGVNPDVIIQVECGHNIGYMNLSKLCQGSKGSCIYYNGLYLTPNEFQFVSGRETAKDWKRSIRHNGKSLKLLIKRKLISVHSNSCECFHTNKVRHDLQFLRNFDSTQLITFKHMDLVYMCYHGVVEYVEV